MGQVSAPLITCYYFRKQLAYSQEHPHLRGLLSPSESPIWEGRPSFLTAPLLQHFIHIPLLSTHPLGPYSVSGSGTVGPSSLAASPLPTGMGGGSRLSAEALFL